MIKVKIHGSLGKKFKIKSKYYLYDAKDIMSALEANNKGFRNHVLKMHRNGLHYAVIVDGKNISDSTIEERTKCKKIDIVPIICGQFLWIPFLAAVVGAVASAAVLAAGWGFLATTLALVAIAVGVAWISAQFTEYPESPEQNSAARALERSFSFANKANVAAQGTPIPLGYGRLKIGSYVISFNGSEYPLSHAPVTAYLSSNDGVVGPNGNKGTTS